MTAATLPQSALSQPPQTQPALREVRLYGHLGRLFGRLHRLSVRTPAEAVQALCAVLPGFDRAFLGRDGMAQYHVFVGRGARRNSIAQDEADEPVGALQPIRLVPVVAGCKKGGLFNILLGAALFFGAPYLAGAFGVFGSSSLAYAAAGALGMVGKALILGGISELISPQPQSSPGNSGATEASAGFNGPANQVAQGGPIPLGFGRYICGSVVVSQGLSTDEFAAAAPEVYTPPELPTHQPLDPLVNLYPHAYSP